METKHLSTMTFTGTLPRRTSGRSSRVQTVLSVPALPSLPSIPVLREPPSRELSLTGLVDALC
jgi:hypothetical protein